MRILENHPTFEAVEVKKETGIRRGNDGGWHAIKAGTLVGSFYGPGSKAAAIQAAGTNRCLV